MLESKTDAGGGRSPPALNTTARGLMEPPSAIPSHRPPTEALMMYAGASSPNSAAGATSGVGEEQRGRSAARDGRRCSVSSRSQWQPDAADVEMMHSLSVVEALPVSRMAVSMAASLRNNRRSIKRMKVVDLGSGPFGSESPFGNDGRPSLPPPGAFAGAGAALGPDAHGGFQASGTPHLGLPSSSFGDGAATYAVSGRPASLAATGGGGGSGG